MQPLRFEKGATRGEILARALAAERNAARFYAALARDVVNPIARKKLEFLASQEGDHARRLEELRSGLPAEERAGREDVSEFAAPLGHGASVAEVLAAALGAERAAVAFYGEASKAAVDDGEKMLYADLSRMEETHVRLVQTEIALLKRQFYWGSLEAPSWVEEEYWE